MNDGSTNGIDALIEENRILRAENAELRLLNGELRAENAELKEMFRALAAEFSGLKAQVATLPEEAKRQKQRADAAEEMLRVLRAERDEQARVMAAMNGELEALKRQVFGKRSEKMPAMAREVRTRTRDCAQARLDAARRRAENREARKRLETRRIEHPVDRSAQRCPKCGTSGTEFKTVGTGQQTEIWEYIPARFERQVHLQETLACPCGEHLVTAPGPARVVDGGSYGPGFISHLLVSKGCDSLPFYRMERQFMRLGIPVARATMVRLFHTTVETCLAPLARRILELVRESDLVLADETPMGMQRKEPTGKAGKGYVWTFIAKNLVAYRFSATRSGETPKEVLGGTAGTLVVDAYTGYNKTCSPESRTRAGCLAHVRRKFFDAKTSAPEAQAALDLIVELYLVEHEAQEAGITRTPTHLALRKERSAPIMARFKAWLVAQQGRHLPKGPMGKAITYALDNWEPLTQFLLSEQTPLDNNRSEAALRVVALYRKNSLFVGNEEFGQNLADLLTVLATCTAHGINPLAYLTDILPRIQAHPASRIDELLPQNWIPPPQPAKQV